MFFVRRPRVLPSRPTHEALQGAGRAGPARRLLTDCRAVAAVEFALLAPLLFMLVLGILAWGQFFIAQLAVSTAAQQGARASVGGLSTAERTSLATAAAASVMSGYASFLNASSVTTTAVPAAASAALFSVTVSYNLTSSIAATLVPVPTSLPTSTVTVSISTGGY